MWTIELTMKTATAERTPGSAKLPMGMTGLLFGKGVFILTHEPDDRHRRAAPSPPPRSLRGYAPRAHQGDRHAPHFADLVRLDREDHHARTPFRRPDRHRGRLPAAAGAGRRRALRGGGDGPLRRSLQEGGDGRPPG